MKSQGRRDCPQGRAETVAAGWLFCNQAPGTGQLTSSPAPSVGTDKDGRTRHPEMGTAPTVLATGRLPRCAWLSAPAVCSAICSTSCSRASSRLRTVETAHHLGPSPRGWPAHLTACGWVRVPIPLWMGLLAMDPPVPRERASLQLRSTAPTPSSMANPQPPETSKSRLVCGVAVSVLETTPRRLR